MKKAYVNKGLEEHIQGLMKKLSPYVGKWYKINYHPNDHNEEGQFVYADEGLLYHFEYNERGETLKHLRTSDLVQVSFWAIHSSLFDVASRYEMQHRKEGIDHRKVRLEKEFELLSILGEEYRQMGEEEYKWLIKILEQSS